MMSTKSINFMTLPPPPSAKPTTDLLFKNAQQMQNKCTSSKTNAPHSSNFPWKVKKI